MSYYTINYSAFSNIFSPRELLWSIVVDLIVTNYAQFTISLHYCPELQAAVLKTICWLIVSAYDASTTYQSQAQVFARASGRDNWLPCSMQCNAPKQIQVKLCTTFWADGHPLAPSLLSSSCPQPSQEGCTNNAITFVTITNHLYYHLVTTIIINDQLTLG